VQTQIRCGNDSKKNNNGGVSDTVLAMADEEKIPGKPKGALGDVVKAESLIQLAIMLPAACFIGWVIGTVLDEHFHTGWMMIGGVLLGAVAGFVQMFTVASRYLKRDGGR
jgi:F0F1-type ATP synthase assembly protein I